MPHAFSSNAAVAMIDIGSNSVRLVIYDALKRCPLPLYNEKSMCELAKGLSKTGRLHPEGRVMAETALMRFVAMARVMEVAQLHVLATAAVRDAADGAEFIAQMEALFEITITKVSGDREAQLGALAILSSVHAPDGITGDLGGGSLEMVALKNGVIADHVTAPVGILRLMDESGGNHDAIKSIVQKTLSRQAWLQAAAPQNFYAIGGSFRSIAAAHMRLVRYPLTVLHNYTVPASALVPLLKELASAELSDIASLPGVSLKRASEIMPASNVLLEIIKTTACKDVVFSTYGIREGFLFERLAPSAREEDALIAGSVECASHPEHATRYAQEVFAWMSPLFADESPSFRRLRLAACMLSEVAWFIHPEYRAVWAFHRVLHSSLVGITHRERVLLALMLYHRYQHKLKDDLPVLVLVSDTDKLLARMVGTAASLAGILSGAVAGALQQTTLRVENGSLALHVDEATQNMMGDAVKKRLDGLEELFKAFSSKR